MLADSEAFKAVFGRGCALPARKCERGLYKELLASEIRQTGVSAPLGGVEFAEDIVREMNLLRVSASEPSMDHLLRDLRAFFARVEAG